MLTLLQRTHPWHYHCCRHYQQCW